MSRTTAKLALPWYIVILQIPVLWSLGRIHRRSLLPSSRTWRIISTYSKSQVLHSSQSFDNNSWKAWCSVVTDCPSRQGSLTQVPRLKTRAQKSPVDQVLPSNWSRAYKSLVRFSFSLKLRTFTYITNNLGYHWVTPVHNILHPIIN